jgi:hypothetical protein
MSAPDRFARLHERPHQMSDGERVVATIALFVGLLGVSILAATFGAIAAFWVGIAGGWALRSLDAWLGPRGG